MPKNALRRIEWKQIAFGEKVSSGHDQIIELFTSGMIKTEKLVSPDNTPRFAFRLSKQGRAICTSIKFEDEDCLVVLSVDPEHKYDKTSGMAKDAASGLDQDLMTRFDPDSITCTSILKESVSGIETADGKMMVYSREQTVAANSITHVMDRATLTGIDYYIVNGLAGSGKTTVAHDILSQAKGKAIYLTKSIELVSTAKKTLNSDGAKTVEVSDEGAAAEDAPESKIQCLSYEQLISKKLFKYFPEFVNKVLADKKTHIITP